MGKVITFIILYIFYKDLKSITITVRKRYRPCWHWTVIFIK